MTAPAGERKDASGMAHEGDRRTAEERIAIVTGYGFWIFLLSDIIMFASFFAGYAALASRTAGGPRPADLFEMPMVALQTVLLLSSTLTCGLASVAVEWRRLGALQFCYMLTGLLGAAFLALEVHELGSLLVRGAGPDRSAFLTAFFTLVGCHGIHILAGLVWIGTVMAQFQVRGFQPYVMRRAYCFNLFWHALDIVWVAIFSMVYLWGIHG